MEAAVMWASDTQQEITVCLIITVMGGDCCERGHGVKDSVWVALQSWLGTASLSVVMFELNLMKCRMNVLADTKVGRRMVHSGPRSQRRAARGGKRASGKRCGGSGRQGWFLQALKPQKGLGSLRERPQDSPAPIHHCWHWVFSISSVTILGLPTNLHKHSSRFYTVVFSLIPLSLLLKYF